MARVVSYLPMRIHVSRDDRFKSQDDEVWHGRCILPPGWAIPVSYLSTIHVHSLQDRREREREREMAMYIDTYACHQFNCQDPGPIGLARPHIGHPRQDHTMEVPSTGC
jgi:hypothetical protein